jgi:hypothetical protein
MERCGGNGVGAAWWPVARCVEVREVEESHGNSGWIVIQGDGCGCG